MDLATFLAARLDEDEATAVAAGHADGPAGIAGHSHWLPLYGTVVDAEDPDWAIITETLDEINVHIARHDPARVLREVAAKRALLNFARTALTVETPFDTFASQKIVRHLAAVYADHPDYDQGWAPG